MKLVKKTVKIKVIMVEYFASFVSYLSPFNHPFPDLTRTTRRNRHLPCFLTISEFEPGHVPPDLQHLLITGQETYLKKLKNYKKWRKAYGNGVQCLVPRCSIYLLPLSKHFLFNVFFMCFFQVRLTRLLIPKMNEKSFCFFEFEKVNMPERKKQAHLVVDFIFAHMTAADITKSKSKKRSV